MTTDLASWLGSVEGRETIERAAREWHERKRAEVHATETWDAASERLRDGFREIVEGVLASALSSRPCGECGGSGVAPCDCDQRGRTHREVCGSWLRCRFCTGSGTIPAPLAPRQGWSDTGTPT